MFDQLTRDPIWHDPRQIVGKPDHGGGFSQRRSGNLVLSSGHRLATTWGPRAQRQGLEGWWIDWSHVRGRHDIATSQGDQTEGAKHQGGHKTDEPDYLPFRPRMLSQS